MSVAPKDTPEQVPASGYDTFEELCHTLINEEGFHWLHPVVSRSRSTEWIAEIHSFPPDDTRAEMLAFGQRSTMEAACYDAVKDFHDRRRIRARKAELLKDATVQEAFKLFGHNAKADRP